MTGSNLSANIISPVPATFDCMPPSGGLFSKQLLFLDALIPYTSLFTIMHTLFIGMPSPIFTVTFLGANYPRNNSVHSVT